MKFKSFLGAASAIALATTPALAQNSSSTSGSGAEANSGSISGSAANGNQQGQSQSNIGGNNAGIGTSRSASDSDSTAISGSDSRSNSNQSQSNDSRTTTSTTQAQTQGQMATNQQGVSVQNNFISTPLKRQYIGTNNAVPLVASSSFSSDYCGGTISGGASVAPIGVSIGASAPRYDSSCRYLRIAEKAGMMGANWANLHQEDMAIKAQVLGTWAVCMAGPRGKDESESETAKACMALGLMGSTASPPSAPPAYVPPAPVTPQAVIRSAPPEPDYSNLPPKTPRGENEIVPPAGEISHSPTPMASASMR